MDRSLVDRVALVTGASRGIGRAVAIELARGGARIFINYLSNDKAANETITTIGELEGKGRLLPFDVSDEEAGKKAIKIIMEEAGRIDILVNNAGVTRDGLLMRMKTSDWNAAIDVNLKGAFFLTRAVSRHMVKARYGRIVNIASVVAQSGREGQVNYSASKAGLMGLTKSVARELAGKNITCNAIAPGFIDTDLTAGIPRDIRKSIRDMIPMDRFGKPEEVASVARWLVSDAASYITGAVIPVNGGMYM